MMIVAKPEETTSITREHAEAVIAADNERRLAEFGREFGELLARHKVQLITKLALVGTEIRAEISAVAE